MSYVRLQIHFMREKSHFPYILESGKPSLHEDIAAFSPFEPTLLFGSHIAASQPWALRNTLLCCFFERSP